MNLWQPGTFKRPISSRLFPEPGRRAAALVLPVLLLTVTLAMSACAAAPTPAAPPTATPTPTSTSTPTATATPTATPTATATPTFTPPPTATPTPRPTATPTPTATPVPTPKVVIPPGWSVFVDSRLGYSLAAPPGWLKVDLRSDNLASVARFFGAGAVQLIEQINALLETPQGEGIGIVFVEPDLSQLFAASPFPTVLNVTVVELAYEPSPAQIEQLIRDNAAIFGKVEVQEIRSTTINNLPGVRAVSSADLSEQGMAVQVHVEQAGLLANNKLYVLSVAVREDKAAAKLPLIEQIIGSFRPE